MTDVENITEPPSNGPGQPPRDATPAVVSPFGKVLQPIQQFFQLEASGGVLLLVAAVAALVWANSPARDSYRAIFATPVVVGVAGHVISVSVRRLINEPLMTVFF